MTREEAIKVLKRYKSPYTNCAADAEANEAIDKAISALEQEPRKITYEDVKGYCKPRCLTIIDNELLYELTHPKIKALEQESSGDLISRQAVKEQMIKYGFRAPDMTVTEFVEDFLPVKQEPKTGHWIKSIDINFYKCSECGCHWEKGMVENCNMDYCPNCGAKMVEPQERSDKE